MDVNMHIRYAESWVSNPRTRPTFDKVREVTSVLLNRIREQDEMLVQILQLVQNRPVLIKRGNLGRGPDSGAGFGRLVPAVILKIYRNEVECALLVDDVDAVCPPSKKGEIGRWAISQIVPGEM